MTKENILARLQNGESAEIIANELVKALNDANDEYKAQKEAEAEAAKANKAKVEDMQEILDLLHDFWINYYCKSNEDIDSVEAAFADLTAEKVIEIFDDAGKVAFEFQKQLEDLEKLFDFKPLGKPVKVRKIDNKDADAIINAFLKNLGL